MNQIIKNSNLKYYFFYGAAAIIILTGFKVASEIVVILFLAIFIASIAATLISSLQALKIPTIISYILVIFISISFFVFLFFMITKSISSFSVNLPLYQSQIEILLSKLFALLGDYVDIDKTEILKAININYFWGLGATILGSVGTLFSKLLLVLIGVVFILSESTSFEKKLKIIFKKDEKKLANFKLFSSNLQKYLIAKTFTSSLTGIFVYVLLVVLDIDYPVLWAMIALLFNFIPFIGSIAAAIPAVLLSLMSHDIVMTLVLIFFYMLINISISYIVEPRLMGQKLGLSPMIIFFSLIFFGWILGIGGMFLAVPLTMTLKIAFDSNPNTHWIGVILSYTK